jgi:hypothetical protein
MEDRQTPALYLELSSADPATYAAERVPAALDHPGVQRASWWRNAHPDRKGLPRRVEEFSLLGLIELEQGAAPPPPAPGATGLHFRRTPRPGQGSLSGERTDGLLLVLVSPKDPARAQELRDWADFIHLRHIAEAGVPGYRMITPYEHAEGGTPRFLHLYELHGPDPDALFRGMTPRVQERLGGGPGHPPFDEWAGHAQLQIEYVNTFGLLGARPG